jgi:hypothetical protein
LEDLPVEIEEGALAAQFLQAGVGKSNVQAGIGCIVNYSCPSGSGPGRHIGELAIHLDVAFAGKGEGVGGGGGAGVAEQAAEDFGEEVRQQRSFLEIVGAAGSDEAGPVLELGLPVPDDRVTWVTCVAWLHERNACDAGRGAPGAGCHKTRLGLRQKATQSHLKAIC